MKFTILIVCIVCQDIGQTRRPSITPVPTQSFIHTKHIAKDQKRVKEARMTTSSSAMPAGSKGPSNYSAARSPLSTGDVCNTAEPSLTLSNSSRSLSHISHHDITSRFNPTATVPLLPYTSQAQSTTEPLIQGTLNRSPQTFYSHISDQNTTVPNYSQSQSPPWDGFQYATVKRSPPPHNTFPGQLTHGTPIHHNKSPAPLQQYSPNYQGSGYPEARCDSWLQQNPFKDHLNETQTPTIPDWLDAIDDITDPSSPQVQNSPAQSPKLDYDQIFIHSPEAVSSGPTMAGQSAPSPPMLQSCQHSTYSNVRSTPPYNDFSQHKFAMQPDHSSLSNSIPSWPPYHTANTVSNSFLPSPTLPITQLPTLPPQAVSPEVFIKPQQRKRKGTTSHLQQSK